MKARQVKSHDFAGIEASAQPFAAVPLVNQLVARTASVDGRRHDGVVATAFRDPGSIGGMYEAQPSSCGDDKGRVPAMARPLRLQCRDCEELLHELANIVTAVVIHAQMLSWKLPPYSHLKRSVREIERNAQRGSELLKQMARRIAGGDAGESAGDVAPESSGPGHFGDPRSRPHKRV